MAATATGASTHMAGSPLDSFQGGIKKSGTSPLYTVGLIFVAGAMIVLPLVYLFLTGLAGYGVFYYSIHAWGPLLGSGHGGIFLRLLLYLTPLFTGSIVVL